MAKHIYCHIPFCAAKCPYCDFYSESGRDNSVIQDVFSAMRDELRSLENHDRVETIYIGGGTPSFVNSRLICFLLDTIRDTNSVRPGAEITIEVNPSSMTYDKAMEYRDAGINRVSAGVQSLHDEHLKTLGRLHDAKGAEECIRAIQKAGIENISADLIIALPGQTTEDVVEDLKKLAELGVKHISTYSLSIEKGTPFYRRYSDIIEDLVPPEREREMYHAVREKLVKLGFIPYEISNSCLPGYVSRHNSSYWEGEEYFGIGAGAHGYIDGRRYMHRDDINQYIKDPLGTDTEEILDDESKMREYPFLKLRTTEGMNLDEFKRRFSADAEEIFGDAIKANIQKGLLIKEDGFLRLTRSGIDWSNKVFEDFLC